ncbi:Mitochondrial import inner membrane translocase subunit Tim9 [Platanthera guangdongensis]|uniref:Mitochondrial import inner membrane translocase subunit Tim9 n=2 Tax=Platanthera guangdongensis TaxID=2320717 RepID=A0ABR2M4T0_9ASPA
MSCPCQHPAFLQCLPAVLSPAFPRISSRRPLSSASFDAAKEMQSPRFCAIIRATYGRSPLPIHKLRGITSPEAATHYSDPEILADVSAGLGESMVEINLNDANVDQCKTLMSANNDLQLHGFLFIWGLMDFVMSIFLALVPWIVVVDGNVRRRVQEVLKEGVFLATLLPGQSMRIIMYKSLVERCFDDCVDSFRRKTIDKQEETCVRKCAEKFLKHSMRVGMRLAELNQGAASQD